MLPAPKPPQLDQKNNEMTKPMTPTIKRITPTVFTFRPETVAVTAQINTAPAAATSKLVVIPLCFLPVQGLSPDRMTRVGDDQLQPAAICGRNFAGRVA